jgi:hypothetical protein
MSVTGLEKSDIVDDSYHRYHHHHHHRPHHDKSNVQQNDM